MVKRENEKRAGAFFDLDLTITEKDSFRCFLKKQYLYEPHNWRFVPYVTIWGILRKLRLVSLQAFKEKALVFLKGKEKDFIRQVGKSFLETNLIDNLRDKALDRIKWHQERGDCIFIVTSCPDIYLDSLTEYLRCDGYEGTELAYADGKFTGRFEGKDCLGSEKVKRMNRVVENECLDLSASFAYSDHESDVPALELVGNPVAVSPTVRLRIIAAERGWKVEEW